MEALSDSLRMELTCKGVTTDIKWKDHLCFNIGEKIFLITSPDNLPLTASFKVSDEDFLTLSEREGIPSVNISPFVKLSLLEHDSLEH